MGKRGFAGYEQNWTPDAHLAQYFSIIASIAQSRR
jgi:hypothetical protein